MNKYFELIGLIGGSVFILPDNSRIDLRLGFPKNTLSAFKQGLWCLGLLPGAEVLFKKDTTPELLNLIKNAKRIQDVEVLIQVKPKDKAIEKAAADRIAQLSIISSK